MPADTSLAPLAADVATVFFAGLLRGYTGFGFSIAAVPLLSLARPPADVVPVAIILQMVVSLAGLRAALTLTDWRSLRLLAPGAVAATPLGAWALTWLPADLVRLMIALVVAGAVVVLGRGRRLARETPRLVTIACGVASGLANGLVGMSGPPVIAYYLAWPGETAVARASMIVLFGLTAAVAIVPLAAFGLLTPSIAVMVLAGIPAVLAGSALGARLYARSSDAGYRRVGLLVLAAAAALAAARALLGLL